MSESTLPGDEQGGPFSAGRLGPIELRNRFIRAAAFEGLCPAGEPTPELIDYHRELAAGGVGMTTVAYAAVSSAGRAYPHQLALYAPGAAAGLRRLTEAVHREGAALSLQLAHAGGAVDPAVSGEPALGPSTVFNRYTLNRVRAMTATDIEVVTTEFETAARAAREAGFDAVEVHAAHGYLLSQFLSPVTNRRRDAWGGDLDRRLAFPREVVRRVREAVGPSIAVLVKMNVRDHVRGGLQPAEAVEVAHCFEREGADALVLSGGFMTRAPIHVMRGDVPIAALARDVSPPHKRLLARLCGRFLIPAAPFYEAYFLSDARRLLGAVDIPLALVGGLRTLERMKAIVAEGIDFLALARPLIAEPDLVRRLASGEARASRCEPCNLCLASVARGPLSCPLLRG